MSRVPDVIRVMKSRRPALLKDAGKRVVGMLHSCYILVASRGAAPASETGWRLPV